MIQSEGGHQNKFIFAERAEYDTVPGESSVAGGKYGGEGYRGYGVKGGVPPKFPTADKTPLEAGRWCPDGRGYGTHVLQSSLSTRGR